MKAAVNEDGGSIPDRPATRVVAWAGVSRCDVRGIEDRLACDEESPNVEPHAASGTVVGPLAFGTNVLPERR
jgi:hypothetical protein